MEATHGAAALASSATSSSPISLGALGLTSRGKALAPNRESETHGEETRGEEEDMIVVDDEEEDLSNYNGARLGGGNALLALTSAPLGPIRAPPPPISAPLAPIRAPPAPASTPPAPTNTCPGAAPQGSQVQLNRSQEVSRQKEELLNTAFPCVEDAEGEDPDEGTWRNVEKVIKGHFGPYVIVRRNTMKVFAGPADGVRKSRWRRVVFECEQSGKPDTKPGTTNKTTTSKKVLFGSDSMLSRAGADAVIMFVPGLFAR
ncbi:unnamed protein product [Ectocarpus sp. CCAP 1310/34]|nr:unnamed protein product [Ectocarpus sp. CCAP 1310/34]